MHGKFNDEIKKKKPLDHLWDELNKHAVNENLFYYYHECCKTVI